MFEAVPPRAKGWVPPIHCGFIWLDPAEPLSFFGHRKCGYSPLNRFRPLNGQRGRIFVDAVSMRSVIIVESTIASKHACLGERWLPQFRELVSAILTK